MSDNEMLHRILDLVTTQNDKIDHLDQRMGALEKRMDGIDQRLDGMDKRFDGIDQRLDGMDKRFDGIDQRLDGMDKRFDGIDQRLDGMDKRFDGVDKRFDEVDQQFVNVDQRFESLDQKIDRVAEQTKTELKAFIENGVARDVRLLAEGYVPLTAKVDVLRRDVDDLREDMKVVKAVVTSHSVALRKAE